MFYRGQEEAPFQLLVAVILMTFVIIVGLRAMEQADEQKCFYETDKAMDDLRLAIENTAQNKTPSIVNFNPPGCTKNESFVLRKSDDERICKNACLNSSTSCVLLRYSTSEVTGIQDKCVNISYDTQFWNSTDHSAECVDMSNQDFKPAEMERSYIVDESNLAGLELGQYYFGYFDDPSRSFPAVCVYIKD